MKNLTFTEYKKHIVNMINNKNTKEEHIVKAIHEVYEATSYDDIIHIMIDFINLANEEFEVADNIFIE